MTLSAAIRTLIIIAIHALIAYVIACALVWMLFDADLSASVLEAMHYGLLVPKE
jgi:hypothetical protein